MERALELLKSLVAITHILRNNKKATSLISITSATLLLYTFRFISASNEKRKRKVQGIKDVPIPGSRYPYVGHMMSLGKLPGRKFSEWHKKLGPIINFKMGCQEWISIDDPILAHKVFVTHGADTSYRPYFTFHMEYYGLGGKGLAFSQPSDAWNMYRSAALSILAPKLVERNYMDLISEESNEFALRLIEATENTGGTDPMKSLELLTMNVIFNIGFGRKFDSVDDSEFCKLAHMIETAMSFAGPENDMSKFLPITKILVYFAGTERKAKDFFQNVRDPTLRRLIREAFDKEGPNLVKSLGENGFEMSEDEMLVFMSDLLIAGTDTIAVTLAWNFVVLCHHPDVQRRVTTEIDAFIRVHGRIPNFSERTEVPLCISIMKECMRYRPTNPFAVPHTTRKDIVVDGYLFPKDCTILTNIDSLHKNIKKYPNPEMFVPDRFYDDPRTMQACANGKTENRDQFNFGWGRRICPGIHLAEVEMFLAFIQVFSRCYIEPLVEGEYPDIEEARYAGLSIPPIPYKVKFTRRTDSLIIN